MINTVSQTEGTNASDAANPAKSNLNKPIMRGLITAIHATLHGGYPGATWAGGTQDGVWEAMRDLWNAGALTWNEFQWLDAHATVARHAASKNKFGIVANPIIKTAEGAAIIDATNKEVIRRQRFEENRKKHGLQSACDMERNETLV